MKKIINKNTILGLIVGIIISGVTVYAVETKYKAEDVKYKETTVKAALDDLYSKKDNNLGQMCKYVNSTYGDSSNHLSIGTKYECELGDKDSNNKYIKRSFYILEVRNNSVDLIMEQNINESTMSWSDAQVYFKTGAGKTYVDSWTNVSDNDVSLPSSTAIAKASGKSDWVESQQTQWLCLETGVSANASCSSFSTKKTLWLWDYTSGCNSYNCDHDLGSNKAIGYWTKDIFTYYNSHVWEVRGSTAQLIETLPSAPDYGVRPVITVVKSQLN